MITLVKHEGTLTFMDTTPQVAPYAMLLAGLRGKVGLKEEWE